MTAAVKPQVRGPPWPGWTVSTWIAGIHFTSLFCLESPSAEQLLMLMKMGIWSLWFFLVQSGQLVCTRISGEYSRIKVSQIWIHQACVSKLRISARAIWRKPCHSVFVGVRGVKPPTTTPTHRKLWIAVELHFEEGRVSRMLHFSLLSGLCRLRARAELFRTQKGSGEAVWGEVPGEDRRGSRED